MSEGLTVVAFALLVLAGAMGLRNIATTHSAKASGSVLTAQAGGGPRPIQPGGKN